MNKAFPLLLVAGAAAALIASAVKAQAAMSPGDAGAPLPDMTAGGVDIQSWSADVDTLARTIWGENRGGGWNGMQSVANVIMNRAAIAAQHGGYWWGNSITEICLKHQGNTYQFSAWSPSDPNYGPMNSVMPSDSQFSDALQIATMATAGQLPDLTRGATNYYAPDAMPNGVAPAWARGQTALADIAGQLFFAVA